MNLTKPKKQRSKIIVFPMALLMCMSLFIAPMTAYAADEMVLLTPPVTEQPPVPNNITPDGQGEVLDHLTSADNIEFITIETPSGNVFYLIIDHTRSSNNVYFLNSVTEWDLVTLAAEAELTVPPHIIQVPTSAPVVTEKDPPNATEPKTSEPKTKTPTEDESGGRTGLFIFLAIAGAGGFGVIYYLKILKPKKEREIYGNGNDEEYVETDGFEDVEDDYTADSNDDDSDVDDTSDSYTDDKEGE